MIVRWGLEELPGLLAEVGIERPFLIASDRWNHLDLTANGRWDEVPSDRIEDAAAATEGCDGLLVVGGGSAIDLDQGGLLEERSAPRVGTDHLLGRGVDDVLRHPEPGSPDARSRERRPSDRDRLRAEAHARPSARRERRHGHERPCPLRGGPVRRGPQPGGGRDALEGARLIGESLPSVLEDGNDLETRTTLLRGAMHAGAAFGSAGLGLAHAMAQAIGGRYGIAHGAANALCLPPALRFNEPVAGDEIARFAEALGTDDAPRQCEELARLSGFERLRDLGVPEDELDEVAEAAAARPGALVNPRKATPAEVAELLRSIW